MVAALLVELIGGPLQGQITRARNPDFRITENTALATKVYDRLTDSVAPLDQLTRPILRVIPQSPTAKPDPRLLKVATFLPACHGNSGGACNPGRSLIALDNQAIEVCRGLAQPEDCLAVILGHELAHHYKKHGRGLPFASNNVSAEQTRIDQEDAADTEGLLYGYRAGYDTLAISAPAIEAIYLAYHFPRKLQGYSFQGEREAVGRRSVAALAQLLQYFDAGILLFLRDRFGDSSCAFSEVRDHYSSYETDNNLGAAMALAAMSKQPAFAVARLFPWVIEPNTTLLYGGSLQRGSVSSLEIADRLLRNAGDADKGSAAAQINASLVNVLLRKSDFAVPYARDAVKRSAGDEEMEVLAHLALGIAYASRAGEERNAMEAFRGLPQWGFLGADHWMTAVESGKAHPEAFTWSPHQKGDATLERAVLGLTPTLQAGGEPLGCDGVDNFTVREERHGSYRLVQTGRSARSLWGAFTMPGSMASTAGGIHLGSTLADVTRAYGEPTLVRGRCYLFETPQLVFFIDPKNSVTGWMVFGEFGKK